MADLGAIKNNCRKILTDELDNVGEDDDGDFFLTHESAVIWVSVNNATVADQEVGRVSVFAHVVQELPKIHPDLALELLTSRAYLWGRWSCHKRDDKLYNLMFSIDMIGSTLDAVELINAVSVVATVANDDDDDIVKKYGGKVMLS